VRRLYGVPAGTVQYNSVLPPAGTVRVQGEPGRPGQVTVKVWLCAEVLRSVSWSRLSGQSAPTVADTPVTSARAGTRVRAAAAAKDMTTVNRRRRDVTA